MSVPTKRVMTAACACGRVELKAIGAPITSVVCYCDDCQEGSRQIDAYLHKVQTRDRSSPQRRAPVFELPAQVSLLRISQCCFVDRSQSCLHGRSDGAGIRTDLIYFQGGDAG